MLHEATEDGRRGHLADFLDSRRTSALDDLLVVHGNCQAESLRVVLDGPDVRTVRVPPVHELAADDVPHLQRLLGAARVVVSQPVRRGYHGLPVGTADVFAAAPRARTVVVPVVRVAGLYPTHLLVRPRADASLAPPVVPYHDARTLAAAADGAATVPDAEPTPSQVREVAAASQGELRRREQQHGTVTVSDVLERPGFEHARTVNHPGNPVFVALAERVRARLGLDATTTDPGRPLLDGVHAPRLSSVSEAFGLDGDATSSWRLGDRSVEDADVREQHLRWYRERPDVVADGLARHHGTLALLGLR